MLTRARITLLTLGAVAVLACGRDNDRRYGTVVGPAPGLVSAQGGADAGGYTGNAIVLPARLEAEAFVRANELNQDFDEQDETCTNPVQPDVDILELDEGGCSIGYTVAGEWYEYDIYVPAAGSFDIQLRVATEISASLEVSVGGEARQEASVPVSSWTDFTMMTMKNVQLPAGEQTLRITVTSGATNLDWLEIIEAGQCLDSCGDKTCGVDECGRSCGSCGADETCSLDFQCLDEAACALTCGDKKCGLDDCGGSCGKCADALICTPTGQCWDNSVKPVDRHGQLSIDGNRIVDESGEVVQLKGVSTQWLNWEQEYSTSREVVQWLRDNWALSVFRVANGVENNNGYLEEPEQRLELVKDIIDNAIASDVYVIVDWHTHDPDTLDEAKEFFSAIAKEYGDQPHVIYEPFNEPLQLDWSTELKPYHEQVVAEIRKQDPDNLIVLGTPRWSQLPNVAIDDPLADENVAYTLHFYSCTHGGSIRSNGQAALDAGLPVFVTEWGATHADGGTADNPAVCEQSAREWHAWMEDNDVSWAAWKMATDGDTSAFLKPSASVSGGWTDDDIKGHGFLVHEFMMDEL